MHRARFPSKSVLHTSVWTLRTKVLANSDNRPDLHQVFRMKSMTC